MIQPPPSRMADSPNVFGSPQPRTTVPQVNDQSTPSTKKQRHRKQNQPAGPQLDGTVSDSVVNPIASPRSKKQPKQKNGGSTGSKHVSDGTVGRANGQTQRPVSVGTGLPPATPLKEQAYAGPVFQASPAPSSLPVPRFFSKSASVPSAGVPPAAHRRLESQSAVSEQSSPESDAVIPVPPGGAAQSPLDLFFNADKAERERSKSSGHMLSPEFTAARPRPQAPMTEPRNIFQQSGKSIFLRELDGDGDDMPSPRTVPPHNQRPAPLERAQSSPGVITAAEAEQQRNDEYTRSLKQLLFNGVNAPSNITPPHQQYRAQSNPSPFYANPSPSQRNAFGSSTPIPIPGTEWDTQLSQLYGNRKNLSPMFKAARDEMSPRPSNLRQEVHSDTGDNTHFAANAPPHQSWQAQQIDPNSFSRQYLNHQIATSQPPHMSQPPFGNGANSRDHDLGAVSDMGVMHRSGVPPQHHRHHPQHQQQQQHQQHQHQPFGTSAFSGLGNPSAAPESKDLGAMSDDLRRMLNLNVMG